jgi:lipopolysaccharide transport system ATP-binding protein
MPIISVEHLSKSYTLHHLRRQRYVALRDVLAEKASHLFDRSSRRESGVSAREEFWALQDVSFQIAPGERIGIIGRNGAGKSTLLKILSRITVPSKGKIVLDGRVASLLEVGTGFHPELTGRENIFLNGAILGMTRSEIARKFDQIVAFAEVDKFIDTPVKRYSSGMYVRLAFAVAAHLEPEILVVDEVLAVGDAQFQQKCLGRMEEVGKEGRTVLFVSHNIQAIKQLCSRCLLLQNGRLIDEGDVNQVTEHYLQSAQTIGDETQLRSSIDNLPPDDAFCLLNVKLFQGNRRVFDCVENGQPLTIEITYGVKQTTTGLRVFFDLLDTQETLLFRSFHDENASGIPRMIPGNYVSRATIPANLLGPISYELRIQAGIFNIRYCIPQNAICIPLSVESTGSYNKAYPSDTFRGKLGPTIDWETKGIQS